jgi:hypothetical protein
MVMCRGGNIYTNSEFAIIWITFFFAYCDLNDYIAVISDCKLLHTALG